jgi:hypothetical protein
MGKTFNRLLTDVTNFLARTGMSDRQFGLRVMNDTRFVHDLREGKRLDVMSDNVDKANAFMENYRG